MARPPKGKVFRSLDEAKQWAIESPIKSSTEWHLVATGALEKDYLEYLESQKTGAEYHPTYKPVNEETYERLKDVFIPDDIPKSPLNTYKDWKGWKWFFGKSDIEDRYYSFEDATKLVRLAGIRSKAEYYEWAASNDFPAEFLPKYPEIFYKQWQGWEEFLGKKWAAYEESQKFMIENGIDSVAKMNEKIRILGAKWPDNIPKTPKSVYHDVWSGYPKYFGKTEGRGRRKDTVFIIKKLKEDAVVHASMLNMDIDSFKKVLDLVEEQAKI